MKAKLFATGIFCAAIISNATAEPALTIYNQNFAVVRDTVPLELKQGTNEVRFTETTAHLEPDSVILRDSSGKTNLQILEQNYRNDPISRFSKARRSTSWSASRTSRAKSSREKLSAADTSRTRNRRCSVTDNATPPRNQLWLMAAAGLRSRSSKSTANCVSPCRANRSSRN